MTHDEAKSFIDSVAYGEARVMYHGTAYFCNGVACDATTGMCHIEIFPDESAVDDQSWRTRWWHFQGKSREECMKAFLELKYWDGKSFYEVAPEMEWIDL